MRIVIVSDAWMPQVNGVVRTLQNLSRELEALGHSVTVLGPDQFPTVPLPGYREIRLAVFPGAKLARLIEAQRPCAIHIATEGPLGWSARRYCRARGIAFTSAVHTLFPEYIHARTRLPLAVGYALMRRFHADSTRVMVATETVRRDLTRRGFSKLARWSRGVDLHQFRPRPDLYDACDLPRPIWLNVGRIAIEKNLPAFLELDLPGTKLIVGDGPLRGDYARRYPEARFVGAMTGDALARQYAIADAFVFPSRTDTFGLVLLEALAAGLPVAAFPVQGPLDVVGQAPVGCLGEDLRAAALNALTLSRQDCRRYAAKFGWRQSAEEFRINLEPITPAALSWAPA